MKYSKRIYSPSLLKDKNLRGNVAQTMYHEMFHCFEYSMIKDKKVIEILTNPSIFTKSERKWAKQNIHPIADNEITVDGKTWGEACNEDEIHQKENGLPIEESSCYVKDKLYENCPDAGSIVAFTEIEDKMMAVQEDYSGNYVGFDEWVKRNPNKYRFLLRLLSKSTNKNFTFKSLRLYLNSI